MTNALEKYNEYNKLFAELRSDFLEMAQLKSRFDTEKFSVKKEGNYIAHQFHFLIRQYSLTLSELKRMYIDLARKERELVRIEEKKAEDWDLDLLECQRNIEDLKIQIKGKSGNLNDFEVMRKQIVKNNGGKSPTIEEWHAEAPSYWEHQMKKKSLYQLKARETGLTEGVAEVIDWIEDKPLLPGSDNQRIMRDINGNIDRLQWEKEVQQELGMTNRVDQIDKVQQEIKQQLLKDNDS